MLVDRVCRVLAKEISGWTRALGICEDTAWLGFAKTKNFSCLDEKKKLTAPKGVIEVIQVEVVEEPIPA